MWRRRRRRWWWWWRIITITNIRRTTGWYRTDSAARTSRAVGLSCCLYIFTHLLCPDTPHT
jgi:hypothetical protein